MTLTLLETANMAMKTAVSTSSTCFSRSNFEFLSFLLALREHNTRINCMKMKTERREEIGREAGERGSESALSLSFLLALAAD